MLDVMSVDARSVSSAAMTSPEGGRMTGEFDYPDGAPGEFRHPDPLIKSQLLCL